MPPKSPDPRPRVAVFSSGAGSTFAALVEAGGRDVMAARVVLLVVSREDVPAAQLARNLDVECAVIDEQAVGIAEAVAEALNLLTERGVGLLVLAGYLRRLGLTHWAPSRAGC